MTTYDPRHRRRAFLGAGVRLLTGATLSRSTIAPHLGRTMDLTLTTVDGGSTRVSGQAIAALGAALHGDLLVADAADYDAARRIWNAAIDRRPALIARCADAHDVAHAIRFAAHHDALVSVRGGGHLAAGFAVCDGGLLIDLTRVHEVDVDADRRLARVGGGATSGDLDAAADRAGLATTGPIISMVGVGGFTLGGGMGWLHRALGLGCDRLASAEIVTADGRVLEASADRHPDLFWALRGGGGNFGVVTRLDLRLAPIPAVVAGLVVHPLEDLPAVAAAVRSFNATAPDDVGVWLMTRKAPASAALPTTIHGRPVAIVAICYAGRLDAADRVLEPLRRAGRPLVDLVKARPYAEWQRALDGSWGPGFGNQWLGHYLPELTDAAAATLLEHVSRVSSPFSDVKLITLGGAMARVGAGETAFSHRTARYALAIQTRWPAGDDPAPHLAWSAALFTALGPHATGQAYVNFMADEGPARVADAYDADALRRLRAIKAAYDPRNRFRLNQNIQPASAL